MTKPSADTVDQLMNRLRSGETGAAERLVEIFYPELKRIASNRMRIEAPGHTLQPTAVVHEFYLELRKVRHLKSAAEYNNPDERSAFLALAAHLIKRLLIHHSRPLSKNIQKLQLQRDHEIPLSSERDLTDIDEALEGLQAVDPKLRRVVEMRVFEGRSMAEIAAQLNCTPRTVDRYWSVARSFLRQQLGEGE